MDAMKTTEINHRALRTIAWAGRAGLFCLGLLAVLALLVLTALLVPVMLAATMIPTTSALRTSKDRRDAGKAAETTAPRKAMAS